MNTLFKKITTITSGFLLMAVLFVTLESCSEDYLKPKPLSIFTPENALTSVASLYNALAACDVQIREETHGDANPYLTELMFSDLTVEGMNDNPGTNQNATLMVTPTANLDNGNGNRILWHIENAYRGLRNAHVVINAVNSIEMEEAEKNAILGTAYFHRAMRYYRLTQQFGDVPYVGKHITAPRLDFYSTKREVILRKMKEDMEFAVQWVSDNVDRGRPTKGACYHLLTKINLALGEFDDAIASASAVIDGGVYSLMRTPFGEIPQEEGSYLRDLGVVRDDVVARLHWYVNKHSPANKEVLYMVNSHEDLVSSRVNMSIMRQALPFWSKTAAKQIYTPDGRTGTSDQVGREIDLVKTFGRGIGRTPPTDYHAIEIWDDPNDLRHKQYNWMNMEDLVYNNESLKGVSPYYGQPLQKRDDTGKVLTSDTIGNWYGWPHYKLYIPDPRTPQSRGGAGDWYIFRLAETYLLRAEAYWWKGLPADAMADINEVRTRALCAPYTDPGQIDIGTVLSERARELYWEEPRRTELTRIAFIFAQTGKSFNGKSYSLANFGADNFYYDWVMEKNNFFRENVMAFNGQTYEIQPYHVLWPIPQSMIDANTLGHINQNYGYAGYENNIAPLESIPAEEL
jgi:starch-binding outer membrane protein, SusD/RagB family